MCAACNDVEFPTVWCRCCCVQQFDVTRPRTPSPATNVSLTAYQFLHTPNQDEYELSRDKKLSRRLYPVSGTRQRRAHTADEISQVQSGISSLCVAVSNATGIPEDAASFNPEVCDRVWLAPPICAPQAGAQLTRRCVMCRAGPPVVD